MELGLNTFGDVNTDPDGRVLPHAQVIRNVIDEGVLADQVGVDFFGVGEHHRADFAISAPEVLLGVIAGRTTGIRLGTATTVLSTDDPVRVFQRFATLQAATNGRVEIILGRGWFTEGFSLFGHDVSQYDELFETKLGQFATLLRRQSVTWRRKERQSSAGQPVFPPLEGGPLKTWIAAGASPQSALRAARYNMPLMLAVIGGEPQRFKPFIELYQQALERSGHSRQPIGVHSTGYVADSDTQAREELWPAYQDLRDRIGAERNWGPIKRETFDLEVDRGSLYVGSPETVARKIAALVNSLGISRFDMRYSCGRLSHERAMRSIELYGTKVIPLVRSMLG